MNTNIPVVILDESTRGESPQNIKQFILSHSLRKAMRRKDVR